MPGTAASPLTAFPPIKYYPDEDTYEITEDGITYNMLESELRILKEYYSSHKQVTMKLWFSVTDPFTKFMVRRSGEIPEEDIGRPGCDWCL